MRKLLAALTIGTLAALSGCAGLNQLTNDVSTYSQWPAERKPSTYAFERLPSQMANPAGQQLLEDSARRAIEGAGFVPASDPKTADYVVQVGARLSYSAPSIYDDPFWWHGGLYHPRYFGHFRRGYGFGFAGYGTFSPVYEREVAILIRDRKTGTPLYEARATNDGYSSSMNALLAPMFEAAMKDFPNSGINPRRIVTQISG
jgi:hypothetical protein